VLQVQMISNQGLEVEDRPAPNTALTKISIGRADSEPEERCAGHQGGSIG